jgi:hypothetical protein
MQTVAEFCRDHSISIPTYYKLRKAGRGPKEFREGALVRITAQAAAQWRRERENPTGEQAEAVQRMNEKLRHRAQNAAAKSIQSPDHPKNRERRK